MKSDAKIVLIDEEGNEIDFYVISEAKIAGRTYLLVSDENTDEVISEDDNSEDDNSEDDEATALILCAKNDEKNKDEIIYEVVDDEDELGIISKYFEELDDTILFDKNNREV